MQNKDGISVYDTKVCYQNRTWERYEYETILKKVVNSYFTNNKQKEKFLKVISINQHKDDTFKTVRAVCAIGQIFCKDLKERNNWDKRMFSTINGISFPDNWDNLSEEEKRTRLDKVKQALGKNIE